MWNFYESAAERCNDLCLFNACTARKGCPLDEDILGDFRVSFT